MGSHDDDHHEPEQLRKLFIGGLDYRTTDESLKEFFETWGEIVDVVVMKDPTTRRSRGFGFITYSSSSMLDDAMANRPHTVNGRQVETKRAVPREEIGKPEAEVSVKKLFIGGLKDTVEENDLEKYFGGYGKITNISIPLHKDTGIKRGFAFIEFDDYDPVDKVILKKTHVIKGKTVDVKKALSKEALTKGGGSKRGGRGDPEGWNNRSAPPVAQNKWGGNGYGASPWDSQGGGQGWESPAQPWGMTPNPEFGSWGGQESYGGGPMRTNMYTGINRNAPYGPGAGGPAGGYGVGSGGRRF